MANVTLSGGIHRLNDVSINPTRLNGENITVNADAQLIIDMDASTFTGGIPLLGTITINQGEVLIDGRGVRLLDYSGAIGTLALYSTVTGGTSGATGVVIQSSSTGNGTIKLRQVSGRFQTGEVVTTSGWSATVSNPQRQGFIVLLGEQADFLAAATSAASINMQGAWWTLGVGTGQAGQTLQSYSSIPFGGIWVQKGWTFTASADSTLLNFAVQDFTVGTCVRCTSTGTPPAPLVAGDRYYVVSSSGGNVQISTSRNGSPITFINTGSGTHTLLADGETFTTTAGNATLTAANGLTCENGEEVLLVSTGTLPTNFDSIASYFVRDANPANGTFSLATSVSGAAIAPSNNGNGTHTLLPLRNFDHWLNLYNQAFSLVGNGLLGCFYQQDLGTATITFGNGTNGSVLPNGARVIAPNVLISSALIASPTTPSNPTASANCWTVTTSTLGALTMRAIAQGPGCYLNPNSARELNVSFLSCSGPFVFSNPTSTFNLNNAIVSGSPSFYATLAYIFSLTTGTFRGDRLTSLSNSSTANNRGAAVFANCEIELNRAQLFFLARVATTPTAQRPLEISRSRFRITNSLLVGGNVQISDSSGSIEACTFSDQTTGIISATNPAPHLILSNSTDLLVDGFRTLCAPRNQLILLDSVVRRITIRNLGSSSSPLNLQGNAQTVIGSQNASLQSDVTLSNIRVNNIRSGGGLIVNSSIGRTVRWNISDCSADFATGVDLRASNWRARALQVTNFLSALTLTSTIGSHFVEFFTSATAGVVAIVFTPKDTGDLTSNAAYQLEPAGPLPIHFSSGSLLLRTAGDRITYTWPTFIKGFTGFANAAPSFVSGTNTGNLTIEYRIDTGAGFSGAWKAATGANLAAEFWNQDVGFRLQLRITCNTGNSNNSVNRALSFAMTSTATLQAQTLYPLTTTAQLLITGLQPNSEVRIYRASDEVELAGIENSGATFSYPYEWLSDFQVRVVIFNQLFRTIDQVITLGSSGVSLPIQQAPELVYSNP